jgi:hypothetical protein
VQKIMLRNDIDREMMKEMYKDSYWIQCHEDRFLSMSDVQDRPVIPLWYHWCYSFVFHNILTAVSILVVQLKFFTHKTFILKWIILLLT